MDDTSKIYNFLLEKNSDVSLLEIQKSFPNLAKSQINNILYNNLQKQRLITKVQESPPLWKVIQDYTKESPQKVNQINLQDYTKEIYNFLLEKNREVYLSEIQKFFPNLAKSQINNILYINLQKQGLITKVQESPPLWKVNN